MSYNKKLSGFTLMELLITIAITGILVALGLPSFKETLVNNKTQSYSSEFSMALYLAQSEAIKRGVRVVVKPKAIATGNIWQTGWDIFVDNNTNGTKDTGDELIRSYTADAAGFTLKSNDAVFASYIGFSSTGSPVGNVGGTIEMTDGGFKLCRPDKNNALSRSISVTFSGNVSTSKGTGTSCN